MAPERAIIPCLMGHFQFCTGEGYKSLMPDEAFSFWPRQGLKQAAPRCDRAAKSRIPSPVAMGMGPRAPPRALPLQVAGANFLRMPKFDSGFAPSCRRPWLLSPWLLAPSRAHPYTCLVCGVPPTPSLFHINIHPCPPFSSRCGPPHFY